MRTQNRVSSAITIIKLRSFAAVAELSNFRAAAERLQVSQPALSAQVNELEKLLGVPLFNRTTRRVELTDEGARLWAKVRFIVQELDTITENLRGEAHLERGHITVSCLPTLANSFFPAALSEFTRKYPNITVNLIDEPTAPMLETVRRGDADFGVGSEPLDKDGLSFEKLLLDPFVMICRTDDPIAKRGSIKGRDLVKLPLITSRYGPNVTLSLADYFAKLGVTLRPKFEVNYHYTLGGLVDAGMGYGCLPTLGMALTGYPSLVAVPIVQPRCTRTVGVVTRKGDRMSPAADAFLEIAREKLGVKSPPRRSRT